MMKKNRPKRSNFKNLLKRIFNVRAWADWDRVKSGSQYISTAVKGVFFVNTQKPSESFAEAKERLKLSDKVLLAREHALYRNALIMLCLAVFLFFYSIYHLYIGSFHAMLLSLALMMLAGSFAFRYHFWYYQIKHKKLGCSVQEWFRRGILREKK